MCYTVCTVWILYLLPSLTLGKMEVNLKKRRIFSQHIRANHTGKSKTGKSYLYSSYNIKIF